MNKFHISANSTNRITCHRERIIIEKKTICYIFDVIFLLIVY